MSDIEQNSDIKFRANIIQQGKAYLISVPTDKIRTHIIDPDYIQEVSLHSTGELRPRAKRRGCPFCHSMEIAKGSAVQSYEDTKATIECGSCHKIYEVYIEIKGAIPNE
jgi:RNase P subunit RPR2